MANEYLTRTPTSSGNRKVFTISTWLKSQEDGSGVFLCNAESSGANNGFYFGFSSGTLHIGTWAGGWQWYVQPSKLLRDYSGWWHVLIAVDTTQTTESDRANIYINGVKETSFSTEDYPTLNYDTLANDNKLHAIGRWGSYDGGYLDASLSDFYLVDGQALTPDVFGFYKDGDGYQSSGTSQATDFRPGQWSPRAPKSIKYTINRGGGFGVNGYYLPMNDSSNPGADFHCAPNSIIKLKGEDLPQPQNGAPTTSDAFVSQLRQETGTLGFDGAVKFDATGDFLSLESSTDFGLVEGDWTVECYAYITGLTNTYGRLWYLEGSSAADIDGVYFSNTHMSMGSTNVWSIGDGTNGEYSQNKWMHVAVCHDSTSMRMYIDGMLAHTTSNNFYNSSSKKLTLMSTNNGSFGGSGQGLISNFRIVKGNALYTANFTPPTEPLTNVTNTKLLCCQSSTDATAATVIPTGAITANGNAFATRNELTGSIVLAVPGISTATGANLVSNGHFDTNTNGWTSESSAILSVDNGRLKVLTTNTVYGSANQTVTGLEVGKRYSFSVDMIHSGVNNASIVTVITSASGLNILSGWQSTDYKWKTSFVADNTSILLDFQMASISGIYGFWDNVVLKQEDVPRDYSADIRGAGTNKTLTANDTAGVGYELGGYYGSAMQFEGTGDDDYFDTGYSITTDFGSGDYTLECWIYSLDDQAERGIFGMFGNQYGISMRQFGSYGPAGNITLQAHFGQSVEGYRVGTTLRIQDQWNHIAMVKEGTTGTLYLNGVAVGIADNVSSTPYSASNLILGMYHSGSYPYKGYMQDFRLYTIAKYKGGFDVSKPYAPVGIESLRTTADTCKNNFATLNPLDTSAITTFNGSSSIDQSSGGWHSLLGTQYVRSGKWYAEMRIDELGWIMFGVDQTWLPTRTKHVGGESGSKGVALVYNTSSRGDITYNGGNSIYTGGDATAATGDIISIALDLDNNNIKFYKNNILQYNLDNILESGADYTFGVSPYSNVAVTVNFGQNPTFSGALTAGTNADDSGKGLFKYAPPTGFLALCTDNLPDPAIADPGKHFKSVLYTGDDSAGRRIHVGFQPDLVWLKSRTNAGSHRLSDSVRGVNKQLMPDTTATEATFTTMLTSFDLDGFTLGDNVGINGSGYTNVAWCWKANGAAVTNTDGTVTSQVSVNQDAGFSIVSASPPTNTTCGHGLGKEPAFIIYKSRDHDQYWRTWHKNLASGETLYLSENLSSTADTDRVTAVTSSTFTFGNVVANTPYIAYVWAEIENFSKFGKWKGNGDGDGPFLYCGFKPAFILYKDITSSGYWNIRDSSRTPSNGPTNELYPAESDTENTHNSDRPIDFLSNGFKIRSSNAAINNGSREYIFAAFAESPFQTANAK